MSFRWYLFVPMKYLSSSSRSPRRRRSPPAAAAAAAAAVGGRGRGGRSIVVVEEARLLLVLLSGESAEHRDGEEHQPAVQRVPVDAHGPTLAQAVGHRLKGAPRDGIFDVLHRQERAQLLRGLPQQPPVLLRRQHQRRVIVGGAGGAVLPGYPPPPPPPRGKALLVQRVLLVLVDVEQVPEKARLDEGMADVENDDAMR